jgi:Restriction endonuclease
VPVSLAAATVTGVNATVPPEWRSYEELTEELVGWLGRAHGITTVRLERDVLLRGRATENRIDVLWEFRRPASQLVRILFECRSYARRINQQALHSWRSVVDDVSEVGIETIGVMVTTAGYQSGAQRVADSYGIVILELRAPTERDLANRWRSVRVELIARMPQVTDLAMDTTEQLAPGSTVNGALGEFVLDLTDGTRELLMDHLLRGELAVLADPPTEPHPVTRTFASPVLLRRSDERVARVTAIRATVGEAQAEPVVIETTAGEIAWMLADTLTGSHAWFATDGRMWQTPS